MGKDGDGGSGRARRRGIGVAGVLCCALVALLAWAGAAAASVLTVGSFNGKPGKFTRVQAAIDKAQPGDWVLIGPGDYKEASTRAASG